jgi:hypothetical protein
MSRGAEIFALGDDDLDVAEKDVEDLEFGRESVDVAAKFKTIRPGGDVPSVAPKKVAGPPPVAEKPQGPAPTTKIGFGAKPVEQPKATPVAITPAPPQARPEDLARIDDLARQVQELTSTVSSKDKVIAHQTDELNTRLTEKDAIVDRLASENAELDAKIKRLSIVPGTSEFLALQLKIETMEQNHYKREQELKAFLSSSNLNKQAEIDKLLSEREALHQTIQHKNKEIEQFRNELSEFLVEMDKLRRYRSKKA